MLIEFIEQQLEKSRYKLLKNGTYFGEAPGLPVVWANAKNLEKCRKELREVIEDWLLLKIQEKEKIPGLNIKIDCRQLARHA